MAGTAAAGAAGGVAATGGAGLSGAAGVASAAAPFAILAGVAIVATGAILGVAAIFSKDLREGMEEFAGVTDRAADALKREADHRDKLNARTSAMEGRTDRFFAELTAIERNGDADREAAGLRYQFDETKRNASQLDSENTQYAVLRSRRQFAEEGGYGEVNQHRIGEARQAEASALRTVIELEKERGQIAITAAEKQIASAKELLDASKQNYELALQQYEAEKRRVESAEQRLAGLDPAEAYQLNQAATKAQSGEQLSYAEANRLRGLGLYDEQVQQADRRRVTALGLDPVLDPTRQAVAGAEYHKNETKLAITAATEFNVKLTSDKAVLIASLGEAMAPLVDQWREVVSEVVVREVKKVMRDSTINRNNQTKVNG